MSTQLDGFDETIHSPRRLSICAFLATADEVEFAVIRDSLGVTDSVLSKHLRVLIDANYVTSRKTLGIGRPRTWLRLTGEGREAFEHHVALLRRVLGDST